MGERGGRITRRLESSRLDALAKQSVAEPAEPHDDDPLADWDDAAPAVAGGSQSAAPPATARTHTLQDPLTTQLLAEVARRTSTMEVDPDNVAAALRTMQEIDEDVLRELRDPERKVK